MVHALMSCRFGFKRLHCDTTAVTRSVFTSQGHFLGFEREHLCKRRNSTARPCFDTRSTFNITSPPNSTWHIGDGLSDRDRLWKNEIIASKRKSWDFIHAESKESMTRDSYRTLSSVIIPRPIALVSTLSEDGSVPNLAPFSFFSMVSHRPPLISLSFNLSPRRPKDTRNNILTTREFTISIISEAFAEAANSTSVESPADTDEWLISGLAKENSVRFLPPGPLEDFIVYFLQDTVKPPYVRESAVAMECELYSFQHIGIPGSAEPTVTVILGLIKKLHVREAVLCEDGITVDPAKLRPIARLGGTTYGRLLEGFDLPRPSWNAVRGEYPNLSRI